MIEMKAVHDSLNFAILNLLKSGLLTEICTFLQLLEKLLFSLRYHFVISTKEVKLPCFYKQSRLWPVGITDGPRVNLRGVYAFYGMKISCRTRKI